MSHNADKKACSKILMEWKTDTEVTNPTILAIMEHHPAYRADDHRYIKRRGRAYHSYHLETIRLKRALGYVKAVDAKWGKEHRKGDPAFKPPKQRVNESALGEMLGEYV